MKTFSGRTAALLLGSVWVALSGCERVQPKLAPPKPPEVLYTMPVTDYVTDFEEFTGRTEAVFTINITARVTGYLEKVMFKDGDEVKKDDVLFEIDPRPYVAELARAKAAVEQSEAHLTRLEADLRRASNLLSRGNISREEYDRVVGDRNEAEASVGIAKANLRLAELNEGFTRIRSPIDGRLGRRLVDPGNLVKADDTPLVTIVSVDPMYVTFDIDERTELKRRRLDSARDSAGPQSGLPILAGLSDERDFTHKGVINFSDNRIDPGTGTLRVRATMQNPSPHMLSPGMFARVRLPIGSPKKSVLVPEQAVGTDQGRKFLYVLNDKDEIISIPVEVGKLERGMRVVEKGLRTNQRVVVSGLQRVRPGAKVVPKLDETPARAQNEGEPEKDAEKTAEAG
ncbi:MAG: efflux RND transporter periplasmic adaptor subunit [Isosphaeraceae bacterium]